MRSVLKDVIKEFDLYLNSKKLEFSAIVIGGAALNIMDLSTISGVVKIGLSSWAFFRNILVNLSQILLSETFYQCLYHREYLHLKSLLLRCSASLTAKVDQTQDYSNHQQVFR